MSQKIFEDAVEKLLPDSIPARLDKIDEFSIGKVLIYSSKPTPLIHLHKNEFDFTGWPLQSLLAEDGPELAIATTEKFLFDANKITSSMSLKAAGDLSAQLPLEFMKASLDAKADVDRQLKITSNFGKISHVSSSLPNIMVDSQMKVNTKHPVVRRAVKHGASLFVIASIYKGECCKISVSLSTDAAESASESASLQSKKTGESADEKMDYDSNKFTAIDRAEQPTPLAFSLMKVTVDSKGVLTLKLDSHLSGKQKIAYSFPAPYIEDSSPAAVPKSKKMKSSETPDDDKAPTENDKSN